MAIRAPMERPTRPEGEALELTVPKPPPAPAPEPLDPAEAERIRRAQAGDAQAFEDLVKLHQGRAFRIARHMVPSEDDARDLVQEAFLRVFRSLERFDFQYGFATWLHRIVTNLAIDHLRKRRLITGSTASDEEGDTWETEIAAEDQPAPSQRLESSETAVRVRECIASLAPHFQAVLTLRELEGLPCTEIAKIVGATHVTVRWRLHRGRKLFQEEWERRERASRPGTEGSDALPRARADRLESGPNTASDAASNTGAPRSVQAEDEETRPR
jgi:RNA polymerase sigma-70 factor, ECF subfamily